MILNDQTWWCNKNSSRKFEGRYRTGVSTMSLWNKPEQTILENIWLLLVVPLKFVAHPQPKPAPATQTARHMPSMAAPLQGVWSLDHALPSDCRQVKCHEFSSHTVPPSQLRNWGIPAIILASGGSHSAQIGQQSFLRCLPSVCLGLNPWKCWIFSLESSYFYTSF